MAESILPHPDVAILRSSRCASGYRSVYRVDGPHERYCAKVRVTGRLRRIPGSARPPPHQAALCVVRWYQARYGDRWKEYVGKRLVRPKPYAVWFSTRNGGYLVRVWERGRPVEVTGTRLPGATGPHYDAAAVCRFPAPGSKSHGRLLVFETKFDAKFAAGAWCAARWGKAWKEHVWRI